MLRFIDYKFKDIIAYILIEAGVSLYLVTFRKIIYNYRDKQYNYAIT